VGLVPCRITYFLFLHYRHVSSEFHATRIQRVPWTPCAGLKQVQHEDGHLSNFHLLQKLETNIFLQHPARVQAREQLHLTLTLNPGRNYICIRPALALFEKERKKPSLRLMLLFRRYV
jgi:hypothetical protein